MAKRLNKKLVAGLTVAAMVAMTAISIALVYHLRTTDPAVFVQQAEEKKTDKQYLQARKLYLQAFQVSKDPRHLVEAGRMSLELDDAETAVGLWRKALEVDSDYEDAQKEIVELGLELAPMRRSAGARAALKREAERLLEINETSPLGHYALGIGLVGLRAQDAENYDKGIAALENALKLEPDNAKYGHALGMHYLSKAAEQQRLLDEAQQGASIDPPELQRARETIPELVQKAENTYNSLIAVNETKLESTDDDQTRKAAATAYRHFAEFNARRAARLRRSAQILRTRTALAGQQPRHDEAAAYEDQAAACEQVQLTLLEKAVEIAPDDEDVRVALGRYFASRKEHDKAKAEFEKATQMAPDSYAGYQALGELYCRADPPQPDRAIEVYEARLNRPTVLGGALGRRNRIARFTLLHDAVEAILQKINLLGRAPESGELEVADDAGPADKQATSQLLDRAEQYLEQAVSELGYEHVLTHMLRGKILRLREKHKEAIKAFEAADQMLTTPQAELKWNLAQLYYRGRQDGAAYKAAKQTIEARPRFAAAWVLLARLDFERGNLQQALFFADRALALNPRPAIEKEARLIKADCYRRRGEIEKAEQIVKEMTKGGAADLLRMALIKRSQDPPDLEEAERFLLQAFETEPNNTTVLRQVLVQLVSIYQAAGREADAVALTDRAVAANPDDASIQALAVIVREKDKAKRDAALLEILRQEEDPLNRAMGYCRFYIERASLERDEKLIQEYYEKALQHLLEIETTHSEDRLFVRTMFNVALRLQDWERATTYAEKGATLNIDGADGDFFFGRVFLARQDYDEAIKKLRRALNKYPAHSHAYVWLGFALQRSGRFREAFDAYRKAIEYNPNSARAHLAMAKLADRTQNEAVLSRELAECERLKDHEWLRNDPWLKAKLQEKLEEERPLEGIARRESIRRENPEDVDNLLRLAELNLKTAYDLTRQGDRKGSMPYLDKADQYTADALVLQPDSLYVVHKVSDLWRLRNQPEKAAQLIKDLIDRTTEPEPKSRAQLMLAMHYRKLRPETRETLRLADEAYEAAAATLPDREICSQIANWYFTTFGLDRDERLPKALNWFRKALELNDDPTRDAPLRRRLVEAIMVTRDPEDIQNAIDDYRTRYPNDPAGWKYQGQYDVQRGDLDEALRSFTLYLEQEPNSAYGYFRRGMVYFRQSRFATAAADLARAKSLAPNAFAFNHRVQLARALELADEPDRAVTELRGILEEFPPQKHARNRVMLNRLEKVAVALAETLGRQQRWAEQETLIIQFMTRFPNSTEWALRRGRNGEAREDLHKALTGYTKAVKLSNYGIEAVDQMLKVLNQLGQHSQVVQFVRESLPKERVSPFALMRLAQALFAQGKEQEAVAEYIKALDMASSSFLLFRQVAVDMKTTLGFEAAVKGCRESLAKTPDDELLQYLLGTYLLSEDPTSTEARSIFQKLHDSAESEGQKYFALQPLSNIAYARKEWELAKQLYEQILSINPDDPPALNNLAYLLAAEMDRPADALPYAERALEMLPENSGILDTLGWVSVLLGECRDGISALSKAVEITPDLLPASYHLAKAYICAGDEVAAKRQLRRARQLAEQQDDAEYRKLISEAMSEVGMSP